MKKIIVLGLMFCFAYLNAEVITLKDGTTINANIANEDANSIFVISGNEWKKINRSDIASIENPAEKKQKSFADALYDNRNNLVENLSKNEFVIKVGYDFGGNANTDSGSTGATGNLSGAFEYYRYVLDYLGVGAGFGAQIPRTLDGVSGRFGFAPAYVAFKLRSHPQEPYMYGYATGQIGYNMFYSNNDFINEKLDGGFYYAGGFGVVIKKFVVEFLYSVNRGSIDYDFAPSTDVDYSKYTISIGLAV